MKKKTYNNFLKASRLIMKKGYSKEESFKLAHLVFENVEAHNFTRPAEEFIASILSKEEYEREYNI